MEDAAKWHWGEGIKYAVEAVKTLFILNGAAAVATLTFIGNAKLQSIWLILAMTCFAAGASAAFFTQLSAHLTQLEYGNASQSPASDIDHQKKWATAQRWQKVTYIFAGIGLFLFWLGVGFAAWGLWPAS